MSQLPTRNINITHYKHVLVNKMICKKQLVVHVNYFKIEENLSEFSAKTLAIILKELCILRTNLFLPLLSLLG